MASTRSLLLGMLAWAGCARGVAQTATDAGFVAVSTDYEAYNRGDLGHRPFEQYHSTDQFGPVFQVTTWDRSAVSKNGTHIFMRHDGHDGTAASKQSSPLVVDADDLSVVYVDRRFASVFGVRVQHDRGQPYLTFWAGHNAGGFGDGFGLAFDAQYRLAYNVSAHNARHADLHEFALTGHGTALVAAVEWLPVSALTATWPTFAAERGGRVLDARFQEIDLDTGALLFDWRASDHISPGESMESMESTESTEAPSADFDAYHLNSIQKTAAGHYLVTLRHLHAILLVDGQTGDVRWRLGGKGNTFAELDAPADVRPTRPFLDGGVRWQHHAQYVATSNETRMTLFDNYVKYTTHGRCEHDCSRGLLVALDTHADPPTVQILREYLHPTGLQTQSQGSVQPLAPTTDDTGNLFVGWGHCPGFTEHTPDGRTVLDVQFGPWASAEIRNSLDNYRAYKMDWAASPYWDPVVAVARANDSMYRLHASWNGATDVREWAVHASTSLSRASRVELARGPRRGFETTFTFAAPAPDLRYVWAEALGEDGQLLRASQFVDLAQDVDSTGAKTTNSPPKSTGAAGLAVGVGMLGLVLGASAVLAWRHYTSTYGRVASTDTELSEARYRELEAKLDAELEAELLHGVDADAASDLGDVPDGFAVDSDDEHDEREDAPLNR